MGGADAEQSIVASSGDDHEKDCLIAALQRRNNELAAALAARDAFLTMAAHELRNPMTPIVGQVHRLRRQLETQACSFDDVAQAIKRIEWLIDLYVKRATTLLDVSRITTGKLRLEISSIDVADLVRVTAAALEPAAQYTGSALSVTVEELTVTADRLALEQIVDNLLLNAIKYGAGKPIEITVSSDGADFRVMVRDHGVGMSAQAQERIFEPFERAIAYGTKAGFGVGLWVVRQLVDAMGGTIGVDSTPDVGTTFTVTLPQNVAQQP
jgi:signal transduction histidine kinase